MYSLIFALVFIQSVFVKEALCQYPNFGPGMVNQNLAFGELNAHGHNYGYPAGLGPGIAPGLVPGMPGMAGMAGIAGMAGMAGVPGMNPYNMGAELAMDVARGIGSYGGTGVGDVEVVGEMPVIGSTLVAGQVPIIGSVRFTGDVPAAGVVSVSGSCGCGAGFNHYI